jgi:hypothetical protein
MTDQRVNGSCLRGAVDKGSDTLVRYASSERDTRSFCRCGSSLFCDNTEHPDHIDIALANMDDEIDRAPQFHIHFDSRAKWVAIGDDLPHVAPGP